MVLVLTWLVFIQPALRLAIELQHARPRLPKASRKFKRLVGTIEFLFSLSLQSGRTNFLLLPWLAPRMLSILSVACTVMTNLMKLRRKRNRRLSLEYSVTNFLEQDFAGPISLRASEVLGPVSRCRVADVQPHMKLVSRASCPGLIVGVLRILCNGRCTAQRFHTDEHDHTCRVGCPNEPDSSLALQRVCLFIRKIYFFLVTWYSITTEKPFLT